MDGESYIMLTLVNSKQELLYLFQTDLTSKQA